MRNGINRELCRLIKFDHAINYIHKPESVQENAARKIIRNSEIQMDHKILASKPLLQLVIKNK